ncbi:MAG: NrdJb, partial [Gammaproteobacteria bacterium]|nr:NrdJb [Gammaproteobacteria bacterium]
MAKKIDKRIIDVSVVKNALPAEPARAEAAAESTPKVVHMHEKVARPEMLIGSTYKIKTPHSDHALYVTINDIVLNPGTPHELRRPFEMFVNSKSMEHFQWIVALTRIISAVFRKGGDVTFLVEEMRSVFDPKGGYFKKGGRFIPSLVAEIGDVLDSHLRMIG